MIKSLDARLLMGGPQNFSSPSVPSGDKVGWGGLAKKSDWSWNCPPNAKLGHFCYFKHVFKIQLFKVPLSLKVVKFNSKMHLNFSNIWGWTSAGGDKPWSKNGDKCRWGGGRDWQNFCQMGPPVPPGKKPWYGQCLFMFSLIYPSWGKLGAGAVPWGGKQGQLPPKCF